MGFSSLIIVDFQEKTACFIWQRTPKSVHETWWLVYIVTNYLLGNTRGCSGWTKLSRAPSDEVHLSPAPINYQGSGAHAMLELRNLACWMVVKYNRTIYAEGELNKCFEILFLDLEIKENLIEIHKSKLLIKTTLRYRQNNQNLKFKHIFCVSYISTFFILD